MGEAGGGRNFILYISCLGKGALARGAHFEFSNFVNKNKRNERAERDIPFEYEKKKPPPPPPPIPFLLLKSTDKIFFFPLIFYIFFVFFVSNTIS